MTSTASPTKTTAAAKRALKSQLVAAGVPVSAMRTYGEHLVVTLTVADTTVAGSKISTTYVQPTDAQVAAAVGITGGTYRAETGCLWVAKAS